ncbi:hypothetical protein GOB80_11785 [Acetobacter ghanensis]|uniref:Uncharacterized protein n=1 Tax=Acetobacter ghanensis TaxID=431306 RepID=A0ABX0KLE1_9PROT|nr:hypothetical protein [Acetobacter ghanensis]
MEGYQSNRTKGPRLSGVPFVRLISPMSVHPLQHRPLCLQQCKAYATNVERTLAGALIRTTFGAVGKAFSKTPRSDVEIKAALQLASI